jgi:hypothetical protein
MVMSYGKYCLAPGPGLTEMLEGFLPFLIDYFLTFSTSQLLRFTMLHALSSMPFALCAVRSDPAY